MDKGGNNIIFESHSTNVDAHMYVRTHARHTYELESFRSVVISNQY
jgi:hypothetical protein